MIAYAADRTKYQYWIVLEDGFDGESFRRRMYSFKLRHNSDGWRIVDVTSNDSRELEDGFQYAPADVKNCVDVIIAEMKRARLAPHVTDKPADKD